MKEGCLFVLCVLFACHAKISQYIAPFWLALNIVGKPSLSKDAPSWFHNVSTYAGEVIEYWLKFH